MNNATLGFEFVGVTKFYGKEKAISDLSISFRQGTNTAILGSSGCGKSTLLRILAGLLPPSSGEISWGHSTFSSSNKVIIPPHKRNLGMVFQDLGLWPNMNVIDNVLMPLFHSGLSKRSQKERAMEALKRCGISSLYDRKPGLISGGQQQRVAIARAIVGQPSFLLFDEPFSGLDLVTKVKLMDEINHLSDSLGITTILVTHDPFEAMTTCQYMVVLRDGQIEEEGEMESLMAHPSSDILKLFLRQRSYSQ